MGKNIDVHWYNQHRSKDSSVVQPLKQKPMPDPAPELSNSGVYTQ